MRGGEGANNKVDNIIAALGKQRAGMHGGFGIVDGSSSRLKAPWKRAQLLSIYALPPPALSDSWLF